MQNVLHVLNKDHSSDNIEEEMRKGGGGGDDDDEVFDNKLEPTTFKHAQDKLFEDRHLSKL